MKYLTKKNRAILREMVSTDFKVRYQESALGYLWSLLRPLLLFAILYVVFVYVFKAGKGVAHYPAYLLFGIVLWSFFVEATSVGMSSVVSKRDLIRKISIPRFLVVVSTSVSALINLFLNLIVIFVVVLINGIHPSWSWLLLLPLLLELYVLSQAVAFILSALFVKFRDITYIWDVVVQAAFYATPIIYSLSIVPARYHTIRNLLLLNPVAQIIQDGRHAVVTSTTITGWHVLAFQYAIIPIVLVVVLAVVAVIYFRNQSKDFAENL
jgi:ABC-2 type transport system permease protein